MELFEDFLQTHLEVILGKNIKELNQFCINLESIEEKSELTIQFSKSMIVKESTIKKFVLDYVALLRKKRLDAYRESFNEHN